jgi:chromosome condensin MukBEF ATPase and DNA-binding subunit MukB
MEENFNWNLASNSQLKEECERLEKEFIIKQKELGNFVSKIDEYNEVLVNLSKQYREIKEILNKREGKK